MLKKDNFDVEVDRWVQVPLTTAIIRIADIIYACSLGNNLILTHARAVALYRREFQQRQRGIIGITLVSETTLF